MGYRLAVLAVSSLLVGALMSASLTLPAAAQSPTPGLTLPTVTGTLARGGQVTGTLTISRLTNRAGQLVADGILVGNVAVEATSSTTLAPVYASTSTPAPTPSGGTIFAATSTPATSSESFAATSTPAVTSTLTATTTPTATTAVGAVVTSTSPFRTDSTEFPRAGLSDLQVNQLPAITAINQSFREVPLTLTDPDMGACDTLQVDLGSIFVDQLGVQLDLAPALIDLATLPRANRPLGGLFCTVASLLDLGPGSTQGATLNELLPVVNRALSTTTTASAR
jgi:hypothetical protein